MSEKSPQAQRLLHRVNLEGIAPPGNYFHIRYPQSDGEIFSTSMQCFHSLCSSNIVVLINFAYLLICYTFNLPITTTAAPEMSTQTQVPAVPQAQPVSHDHIPAVHQRPISMIAIIIIFTAKL